MSKNIIFVGPQGSGKGTQAKIISLELAIPHISTGDLLRDVEGELRKEVDKYMKAGKLVPDELILQILKTRISQADCKKGFILDGYPRNIEQAKELDKIVKMDKVIELWIPDREAIRRITNRLNCKNCGHVFNKVLSPPKVDGKCDNCGTDLYVREDDNETAIRKRLDVYHKETEPILEHYDSEKVDGTQEKEKVTKDILKALK
jgi:adenylate kinase